MRKLFLSLIFINQIFSVPFTQCFAHASKVYFVPEEILIAIASVESNYNKNSINYNKNGSYDIGVMQINSGWFIELKKYNISRNMLFNPCQNIMIGAWILEQNIKRYGFNWSAIQHYNGTDTQQKYANKIYKKLSTMHPKLIQNNNNLNNKNTFLLIK